MNIPYRQVRIENVPEGYSAKILPENNESSFELDIKGLEDDINSAGTSDVSAVIDMQAVIDRASENEMSLGNYRAAVSVTLPEGISTDDQIRLLVILTKDD